MDDHMEDVRRIARLEYHIMEAYTHAVAAFASAKGESLACKKLCEVMSTLKMLVMLKPNVDQA